MAAQSEVDSSCIVGEVVKMAGVALRQQQTFGPGDEFVWRVTPAATVFAARWQQLRVPVLATAEGFSETNRTRQHDAALGEKAQDQCVGTTIATSVAAASNRGKNVRRLPSKFHPLCASKSYDGGQD